jgi:hypothetical protein
MDYPLVREVVGVWSRKKRANWAVGVGWDRGPA